MNLIITSKVRQNVYLLISFFYYYVYSFNPKLCIVLFNIVFFSFFCPLFRDLCNQVTNLIAKKRSQVIFVAFHFFRSDAYEY